MNKTKIPKNWELKYIETEENTTKVVYEDQYHNEHIYINEKPEPVLPTYKELEEIIDKARIYIKEHSTTIDYETMKADYNLNMNDLLDILQGDNNE